MILNILRMQKFTLDTSTKSLRNLVRLTTFKKGSKQTETHRRTTGINSTFWFPGGEGVVLTHMTVEGYSLYCRQ